MAAEGADSGRQAVGLGDGRAGVHAWQRTPPPPPRARTYGPLFLFLSVTVLCVFCGWAYIFLRLGGRAWMRVSFRLPVPV